MTMPTSQPLPPVRTVPHPRSRQLNWLGWAAIPCAAAPPLVVWVAWSIDASLGLTQLLFTLALLFAVLSVIAAISGIIAFSVRKATNLWASILALALGLPVSYLSFIMWLLGLAGTS